MSTEQYPEASEATTALVLGILSFVLCGVLAPFAWSIGNREVQAIDAGRRPPQNRGTAQAGKILGLIGTILLIIAVAVLVLVAVLLITSAAVTST